MSVFLPKGAKVRVVARRGNVNLTPQFLLDKVGTLMEEARVGHDAGWDVYDFRVDTDDGPGIFSAHGFNLVPVESRKTAESSQFEELTLEALREALPDQNEDKLRYALWLLNSPGGDLFDKIDTIRDQVFKGENTGLAVRGGRVVLLPNTARDPRIKITFDKHSPSEEEGGDLEVESGWEDKEGISMALDEYDIEDGVSVVEKSVNFLKREKGVHEASSSAFHKGVWYIGPEEPDYQTGETTVYSYHLYDFTLEQEREIFERVTAW